ncbi:tachylectin-related carbohydrate-binding protein [Symbioplanes lichenis]|uniref:tachylectin-related carbohydrate-binding protein n=1 Tax=Symbioplanes lichenis TaxID=1629072 RepID=UPI002739C712|nr:tachylectin-related carbohydrate-binding protein [Actinoplanes lichenis]
MRALTLAVAAVLGATIATPARAADGPGFDAHQRAMAVAATQDCVAGGPASADAATATRLNRVLTGSMAGAMDAYRVSCARAVTDAVLDRGLGERAAVIAITTTIVESTIRNVTGGDRDSVGLFQQRDSWGPYADRMNPAKATGKFLDKMQSEYPGGSWRTAPIGEVCQAVQVSAFPERYQPQAADAQRIVDAVSLTAAPEPAVSVYGVLGDGRLTYTTIDAATGNRTSTVVAAEPLAFVPVALATLNFNTVLVTSPDGRLHRVDILTNKTSLTYNPPVFVEPGWTHDLLAYDGHGHLYGVADGTLMQYVVSRDKPGADQIGQRHVIAGNFTLRTLTATGDDWLLGVNTGGELRSYRVNADHTWTGTTLATRWSTFDQLTSPGAGLYYGKTPDGAMYHYRDRDPYDLSGADLRYYTDDPVDTRGWTQKLVSAQPFGS